MKKTKDTTADFDQIYSDAEAKRLQLEEKYKGKIKMAVLAAGLDTEPCVAYFRTATTFTKMQCIDLSYQSPSRSAATYFDATIIREESDPRVFLKDNDEDVFYIGALEWCKKQVMGASSYVKKK